MSRFRLAWARQCGERKAKEHGFTAFPVDPRRIAEDEDIHISPKRPDHLDRRQMRVEQQRP